MARIDRQADLQEAAEEELERAATLGWRELSSLTPWGDTYEGFTPAGRTALFERNYLWQGEAGGDICIEVVVYQPEAYERGVRLTRLAPRRSSGDPS
jgi:hypothetical protein